MCEPDFLLFMLWSPKSPSFIRGTEGSNPSPSSEESRANLKTTSTFALRHSIAIRVPKKTPASMITDTGKVAGGKPATGRLCQAGLREKASVRHLARRLTGYRKESSTNSRDNVQGNSSPQRSERRGTIRRVPERRNPSRFSVAGRSALQIQRRQQGGGLPHLRPQSQHPDRLPGLDRLVCRPQDTGKA
jgi:hypothetical protein